MIFCDANTRELRRAERERTLVERACEFYGRTCYAISSAKMPDARRNRRNARECLVESLGSCVPANRIRKHEIHRSTEHRRRYCIVGSVYHVSTAEYVQLSIRILAEFYRINIIKIECVL